MNQQRPSISVEESTIFANKTNSTRKIYKTLTNSYTDNKRILTTPNQTILSLYKRMYNPKQNGYIYMKSKIHSTIIPKLKLKLHVKLTKTTKGSEQSQKIKQIQTKSINRKTK